MSLGYKRSLYLLPFDHRHSYVTGMFNFTRPLTVDQHETVADSKRVIYDGFRQALGKEVPITSAAILVDEEFGADILRDAVKRGYVTALSTEKSGSDEFEFEYGAAFAEHIEALGPTFAKVLVRYNPAGDVALNLRQTARLKQLSDYCRSVNQLFMFELLVPATKTQMDRLRADKYIYDLQIRPELTLQTIRSLQDAGVEPESRRARSPRGLRAHRRSSTARRPGRGRLHRSGTRRRSEKGDGLARNRRVCLGIRRLCGWAHDLLGCSGRLRGAQGKQTRSRVPCRPALPRVGGHF
jgi:hypothetical protein